MAVACDAVYGCKSVTLTVTSRPHDWKGAMTVAVTEVCKLGKFGVSEDELSLAKVDFTTHVANYVTT